MSAIQIMTGDKPDIKRVIRAKGACATNTLGGILMCPRWMECYKDGERVATFCPELDDVVRVEVPKDVKLRFDQVKKEYETLVGRSATDTEVITHLMNQQKSD